MTLCKSQNNNLAMTLQEKIEITDQNIKPYYFLITL